MKTRSDERDALADRLASDAARLRGLAPPSLHVRVIDAVRAEAAASPSAHRPVRRVALGLLLAAATLLAVLGARRLFDGDDPTPVAPRAKDSAVAERLRELVSLDGTPLLALANEPLASETRFLLDDATRTARGFVDGLPAPFRRTLDR